MYNYLLLSELKGKFVKCLLCFSIEALNRGRCGVSLLEGVAENTIVIEARGRLSPPKKYTAIPCKAGLSITLCALLYRLRVDFELPGVVNLLKTIKFRVKMGIFAHPPKL